MLVVFFLFQSIVDFPGNWISVLDTAVVFLDEIAKRFDNTGSVGLYS